MNWRTVLRSLKNRDMQKRLGIVFGLIIAFRFLAHIPVPLAEPTKLKTIIDNVINSSDFGGFLNLMSGGALGQMSIVLVGLSPFITASIITQLLTKAIPRLEELHKDGESGRRKINQWTRIISVPLAVVQSVAFIYILRQSVLAGSTAGTVSTSPMEWVVAVTAMTAGSVLLMWLGELITEQGIGNGISLVIFAGIVSQLPTTFRTMISSLTDTSAGKLNVFNWFELPVNPTSFWVILGIMALGIIILYFLVKINEAQRIITVNYAKRVGGNTSYGGIKSILPVKLIAAGVIPIIFAVAFLSLPAFVGQVMKAMPNADQSLAANLIKWFQTPTAASFATNDWGVAIYPVAYFLLVIAFTYFYTGIVFNANEIAENLQKQGGFIEGVRPGLQTEKYLAQTVNRLILFGSIALGFIAVMPFIIDYIFARIGINAANISIGGTGLLIVVAVGLETLRQINSRALMVTYDDYK
ncbi:preprotein translocase subunit SecY [Candidatus Saccharibacteria bacterium]|nr:preprotein translocase subunit SecY [Patescibacteria group bacterium]MCA9336754.1 preprotein translocase subunit SecY [Candidatus Saccharibacteria bacterium]